MARDSRGRNSGWQDDLVKIAEVIKPHGIKGEIKVLPYSGQPENFKNYNNIILRKTPESGITTYKIVKSREQGKIAILELEGVNSRDAAEALQGNTVWLMKGDFQKLGPDEYYWHQLENLQVITESGRELGKVSKLFSTSAHDIMVITGKGHEYMVPLKTGIIIDIDEKEGKIVISPLAGLLDINK